MSIMSEYSSAELRAMHKRALADERKRRRIGRVVDKGWQVTVGENWTSLRSYYEIDGYLEMYTTAL